MATKRPKILLIVASPMGVSFLTSRLKESACEIQFASSCYEAKALVSNHGFDLVLGEFGLRDDSSSSLAASLVGSSTTLVYAYQVGDRLLVVAGCQERPTMLGLSGDAAQ